MHYQPGAHLIATLHTTHRERLLQFHSCRELLHHVIEKHSLRNLGEVYHNFEPGGFTAVICLSESHISVHTWPEHGKVNLDIYLSNYMKVNDAVVKEVFEELVSFFSATIEQQTIIRR